MIVLDSHAWIWWRSKNADALSRVASDAISSADQIGISVISCVEVAEAARRNRISLDRDVRAWIAQSFNSDRVRLLPLTPDIAVMAMHLEWNHRDPFDRVIVATTLTYHGSLITKDDRIRRFQGVATIW